MKRILLATAAGAVLLLPALAPVARASIQISFAPTHAMSCAGGVCTSTAKNAVLNTGDLMSMLATQDVQVKTGNGAITITVAKRFSWSSTHRLTLTADKNVSFKALVVVTGPGALTIESSQSQNGDVVFLAGGKLSFRDLSSNLHINGSDYVLVKNFRGIAQNAGNDFVALVSDYDATRNGIFTQSPIQDLRTSNFYGLGHTISNLRIHGSETSGLIKTNHGRIRDLIVSNADIETTGASAGILAGENSGVLQNVVVSGTVIGGSDQIGGIAGLNFAVIENSHASGLVQGQRYVGGIAGLNNGEIHFSSADTTIQGVFTSGEGNSAAAGGLVGLNQGSIQDSWAVGAVSAGFAPVGGLVGANGGGTVARSYATGSVTGDGSNAVGGLAGRSFSPGGVRILQSYATGTASDGASVGGLVGDNAATVWQSYSIGAVTSGVQMGGLLGMDTAPGGSRMNNVWDLDTSGISDPSQGAGNVTEDPGITGLTDAQLKSGLPSGFDPTVWAQSAGINGGYPYLLTIVPPQ